VTATRASVTATPAGLLRAVEGRYGLSHLRASGRLQGGYENDLLRVRSGEHSLVVRIEVGAAKPESVRWEHELVADLALRLPEVVAPLLALDGSSFFLHGGRAVSVLPYVDGRPAERDLDWKVAAEMLGRLHAEAATLKAERRPGHPPLTGRDWSCPDVSGAPAAIRERARELGAALRRCRSEADSLPLGPIHGDYHRGNVLVRDGRVVGLVDWGEAHVDSFAYELANGVWEFCVDKARDDFDRARGRAFVGAYRRAGGVVPEEHDPLLVPLIRCRRALEVRTALLDPREDDWDYQLHNLRSLQHLA